MSIIKKPIVIVGGGFAGINAALNLKSINSSIPILVIDYQSKFIFKPLLYEVFSNEIKSWEVAPYFDTIFSEAGIAFLKNKVTYIDLEEKFLKCENNLVLDFEFLILSTGSLNNNFSIKGVDDNCYFFNNNYDQDKLKLSLNKSCEDGLNKELYIVGGGPSGVELACKIHDIYQQKFKINIIESQRQILTNNKEYNREEAEKAIQARNITLLLNTTVQEVTDKEIIVLDHLQKTIKLNHKAVIWTAGVKPNIPEISQDLKKMKGRLLVKKTLQLTNFDHIFVVGDIAIVQDDFDLPITAQVAMQQGIHVAHNLVSLINQSNLHSFEFKDNGEMISLGIGEASISALGFTLAGKLAFELRRLIYASKMPLFNRSLKSAASWLITKKSIFQGLMAKK